MNEEYRKLYDAVSAKFDIGGYDEFLLKMQTEEQRKKFYDIVSSKGFTLGDYNQYEGRLKKKEKPTASTQQQEPTSTPTGGTTPQEQPASQQDMQFLSWRDVQPPVSTTERQDVTFTQQPLDIETEKIKPARETYAFNVISQEIENIESQNKQQETIQEKTSQPPNFFGYGEEFLKDRDEKEIPKQKTKEQSLQEINNQVKLLYPDLKTTDIDEDGNQFYTEELANGVNAIYLSETQRKQKEIDAIRARVTEYEEIPFISKPLLQLANATNALFFDIASFATQIVGAQELTQGLRKQANKYQQEGSYIKMSSGITQEQLENGAFATMSEDPISALTLLGYQTIEAIPSMISIVLAPEINVGRAGAVQVGRAATQQFITPITTNAYKATLKQASKTLGTRSNTGITLLAGLESRSSYEEALNSGLTQQEALGIGLIKGLAVYATEHVFMGAEDMIRNSIMNFGEEAAKKQVKTKISDFLKESGEQFTKEGLLEEGTPNLIGQIIDNVTKGTPFNVYSYLDESAIGGLMGAGSVTTKTLLDNASNLVSTTLTNAKLKQIGSQIRSLREELLKDNLTPQERKILEDELIATQKQYENVKRSSDEMIKMFTDSEKKRYIEINQELLSINDEFQKTDNEAVKQILTDKANKLKQEKQVIEQKYTNQQVTNQQVTPEVAAKQQVEQQLTPEELEAKKADIQKRRQEELNQYDQEGLKETYTVGSEQTVEEYINAKYDAELSALEQQATPTQQTQQAETQQTTAVETEQASQKKPKLIGKDVVPVNNMGIEIKKSETPVSEVINRPVKLTKIGNDSFKTPLSGELFVEGQRVIFETENGKQFDIGNIDEIKDKKLSEIDGFDLSEISSNVKVNKDGTFEFNGVTLDTRGNKPLEAIRRNEAGEVTSVTMKPVNGGKRVVLRGQDAVDAAYQIQLRELQTQEQQNRVDNEIRQEIEQEYAANISGETTKATTEETTRDTKQTEVKDDTQAKQQVPSGKQEGKATEQAKPKQKPSGKKAEAGRDVQAPTEKEVEDVAKKTGITPKNLRDLYRINRDMFGLNKVKAFASAVVMDRMVGTMAKRAGVSKQEMYGKLEFRKGNKDTFKQLSARGKALFQIVGENANLSDEMKSKLQFAKLWHRNGFDKKRIKRQTGWEIGVDGKWRYEVVTPTKVLKGKIKKLPIVPSNRFPSYSKLKDLIENEELFRLMPELKNIKVGKSYDPFDVFGEVAANIAVDPRTREVVILLGKNEENIEETLLHELQHIIQIKSGFEQGVTPISVLEKINDNDFELIKKSAVKNIEESIREEKKLLDSLTDEEKSERGLFSGKRRDYQINESIKNKDAAIRIINKSKSRRDIAKAISENDYDTAKKLYKLAAGEVEARNVETRTNMTPEQRRKTTLEETEDVARDEQIVLFQKSQGAMLAEDGNYIIYALTDPNVSTPLHELAHVFEHYLTEAERNSVLKWANSKEWTTEVSEKFARGWERFLADGKAPTANLQKIFNKFKEWLTDIYNGITNSEIDIKLNKPMQDIYSRMLGEETQAPTEKEGVSGFSKAFEKGADNALAWLEQQEKELDKFGKETLGINLPVAVAKVAIQAAKVAIKTSKTAVEVLKAAKDAVKATDWYKNLSSSKQVSAMIAVEVLFGSKKVDKTNLKKFQSQVKQRARKGDYTNVSEDILNLVNLPLHKIQDAEIVNKITDVLEQLANKNVSIYDKKKLSEIQKLAEEEVNKIEEKRVAETKPKEQKELKGNFEKILEKIKLLDAFEIITEPTAKKGAKQFRAKVLGLQRSLNNAREQAENSFNNDKITQNELIQILNEIEKAEARVSEIAEKKDKEYKAHISNVFKEAKQKTINGSVNTSWMTKEQKEVWDDYVRNIRKTETAKTLSLAEDVANIIFDIENGYFPTRGIDQVSSVLFLSHRNNQYKGFTNRIKELRGKELNARGFARLARIFGAFLNRRGATTSQIPTKIIALRSRAFSFWEDLLGTKRNGYLMTSILDSLIREDTNVKDEVSLIGEGLLKILSWTQSVKRGKLKEALTANEKISRRVGMLMFERFWREKYGESYFDKLLANEKAMSNYTDKERKKVIDAFNSLEKTKDGVIDIDKTSEKLSRVEIMLKHYIETQFLMNLAPKQEIANQKAGIPFEYAAFYFPVMRVDKNTKAKDDLQLDSYNNTVNAKLMSDRGKEQKSSDIGAVNIDAVQVLLRSAREVLRNYYMYTPLQRANQAFNKMIAEDDATVSGWGVALKYAVREAYNNSFSNVIPRWMSAITNYAYAKFLLSAKRVIFAEPLAEITRVSAQTEWTAEGSKALVKQMMSSFSTQFKNLHSFFSSAITKEERKKSASIMLDLFEFTKSPFRMQFARQDVDAAFDFYQSTFGRQGSGIVSKISAAAMAIPNKITIPIVWMNSFAVEYKRITGKEFDYSKTKDSQYMQENSEDILNAAAIADRETGKLKGEPAKIAQRTLVKWIPEFLPMMFGLDKSYAYTDALRQAKRSKGIGFLSGFMYREHMAFSDNFFDIFYQENNKSTVAARNAVGQYMSGVVYMWGVGVGGAITNYLIAAMRDDDEDKQKAVEKVKEYMSIEKVYVLAKQNVISLKTAQYGQSAKAVLAVATGAYLETLYKQMDATYDTKEKAMIAEKIGVTIEDFNSIFYADPISISGTWKVGKSGQYEMGKSGSSLANGLQIAFPPASTLLEDISSVYDMIDEDVVNGDMTREDAAQLTLTLTSVYLSRKGTSVPFYKDVNSFISSAERETQEKEDLDSLMKQIDKMSKQEGRISEEDYNANMKALKGKITKAVGKEKQLEIFYKKDLINAKEYRSGLKRFRAAQLEEAQEE